LLIFFKFFLFSKFWIVLVLERRWCIWYFHLDEKWSCGWSEIPLDLPWSIFWIFFWIFSILRVNFNSELNGTFALRTQWNPCS
jgi:hypothetical protein